jgi:hypothetical protein
MVGFARLVLQEAVDAGELPGWIDVDSIASAFLSLIDGFVVRALEMGDLSSRGPPGCVLASRVVGRGPARSAGERRCLALRA